MQFALTVLIWIISLLCLAAWLVTGFGLTLTGWPASMVTGAMGAFGAVEFGQPRWLLPAALFYLSFGYVQRAFTEAGFAYAGLIQRKSHNPIDKALGVFGAVNAVLLWPISVALDVVAVLFWHRALGEYPRQAAEKTLRSMRYGLSRDP